MESAKKIGARAFQNCAVEIICIPSSVETIGNSAFEDCNQLTSVLIDPASKLKRVSPSAFQGYNKIRIVEYPSSVKFESDEDENEGQDQEDEDEDYDED